MARYKRWHGVLLLLALLAGACGRDEVGAERAERVQPAAGAPVATILARPYEHFGDEVTVHAEVRRVLKPGAFTLLTADRTRELLVIAGEQTHGAIPQVTPESAVQVNGVVRKFEPEALKEETWSTLDETSSREWIGQPALIARQIRMLEDRAP